MPQFIHLTDERLLRRIERSGLRRTRWDDHLRGVFATPVLPDFLISHQWLRELKGRGIRTIGAVQFLLADPEEVFVGHYNESPLSVTAAQAVKIFLKHVTGLGLQILVPRRIEPGEITRIYHPPQLVGWRYYPESHGRAPCGCDYCQRGRIKNRRLRRGYETEN